MNNARVSVAPQRLKFPGNIGGTTPVAPTLADVMTKLSQVQQNQGQILDAVMQLQLNQMSICVMLGEMFELIAPNPRAQSALDQLAASTVGGIVRSFRV